MDDFLSTSDKRIKASKNLDGHVPAAVIHATCENQGEVWINRIEMSTDNVEIQLRFSDYTPLNDVFTTDMCDFLSETCEKITAPSGMLSLPDMCVNIGTATLNGASILSSRYADDKTALTIRILDIQGKALEILHPSLLNDPQIATRLDQRINDAIDRIYVPLRNFDTAIEQAMTNSPRSDLADIHTQIMAFRTEIENVCYNFERLIADDIRRAKEDTQLGDQSKGQRPARHLSMI